VEQIFLKFQNHYYLHDIRVNTVKDSGGNTLWVSDGAGNITSGNSALVGNLKLLRTVTAGGSHGGHETVSFTSDIDSTYDVYIFKWIDVVPNENNVRLGVNFSSDGGSTYAVAKTTTYFSADHAENDGTAGLQYVAAADLAQVLANKESLMVLVQLAVMKLVPGCCIYLHHLQLPM